MAAAAHRWLLRWPSTEHVDEATDSAEDAIIGEPACVGVRSREHDPRALNVASENEMQRRPGTGDREEKGWRPVVQTPSQKPVTPPKNPASTAPAAKITKK